MPSSKSLKSFTGSYSTPKNRVPIMNATVKSRTILKSQVLRSPLSHGFTSILSRSSFIRTSRHRYYSPSNWDQCNIQIPCQNFVDRSNHLDYEGKAPSCHVNIKAQKSEWVITFVPLRLLPRLKTYLKASFLTSFLAKYFEKELVKVFVLFDILTDINYLFIS